MHSSNVLTEAISILSSSAMLLLERELTMARFRLVSDMQRVWHK